MAASGVAENTAPGAAADYFEQIKQEPIPSVGQRYYTRHCFMYDGDKHEATNYWVGTLVPINTPVTLVRMEAKKFTIRLEESGREIQILGTRYTTPELTIVARAMLSKAPTDLTTFSAEIDAAIKSGRIVLGMTKEQVVMARGYPPTSETPNLDSNTWRYWANRLHAHPIGFKKGVLAEIGVNFK